MYSKNNKGLECFVDTDFVGGWSTNEYDDPASVYSLTGYIIKYRNSTILWAFKLKSEISLSTTEREYISLLQAMREFISMMEYLEQLEKMLNIESKRPIIKFQVFEDNNGAIKLAKAPNICPCTKTNPP